jgi:outer membrane protein OmpA-like peptidoglycan-associated protein
MEGIRAMKRARILPENALARCSSGPAAFRETAHAAALKFSPTAPICHWNAVNPWSPPIVRLQYVALLSLFVSLPAAALTFQPRLEHAEWHAEGDQFECRLIQPIKSFGGVGQFVRRAGELPTFQLISRERWLGNGAATLVVGAAPWRPEHRDMPLGQVKVDNGEVLLKSDNQQAARLLTGLMEGRSPLVRHRTRQTNEYMEVRLLPARFGQAFREFQQCTTQLLPVNFDQVKYLQLSFASSGIDLSDETRKQLDKVLLLLKADPTINSIRLEGHSDNTGNRLTNRDLSRRRALAVANYLKEQGIPEGQITIRFHGERYPLVPNNSEANRGKNRRVTLYLDRLSEEQIEQERLARNASAQPA